MNQQDAIDLIRPAAAAGVAGDWADFGAGQGTFTRALLSILPAAAGVVAVDRGPGALRALRRIADAAASASRLTVVSGDLRQLDALPPLAGRTFGGALFANALHFLPNPAAALRAAAARITSGGRIVVIEYERATANRWVPYPLPLAALAEAAARADLPPPRAVARRPSAYHGEMYCATISVGDHHVLH